MPLKERTRKMIQYFKSGLTYQQIGDMYGISRQRIQQILSKHRITYKDGGFHLLVIARSRERKKLKEAYLIKSRTDRIFRNFKCSPDEYYAIMGTKRYKTNPGGPAQAYYQQCRSAGLRGIKFELTFPQWFKIWKDSGHLEDRGKAKYVMTRFGDKGPYALGNVAIKTSSENIKEGYIFRGHIPLTNEERKERNKIYAREYRKTLAYKKYIKTPKYKATKKKYDSRPDVKARKRERERKRYYLLKYTNVKGSGF